MIEAASFAGIGIMAAGGILLPLIVCICWLLRKKEKVTTVLVGAATWFVFAIILESIPKLILFNPSNSLGKSIMGNAALYSIIGALLAGIFEESGRLIAFKTLLRKRTNKECGISHGIGHGGFEAMFLLGIAGIQYASYAMMIDAGLLPKLIDQAAAAGADTSSLEALPALLMSITPLTAMLSLVERASAMLLHVSLSVVVFHSARSSKPWLFFLAIAIHTLFDLPAALYQAGVLNLYLVELLIAVYAVVFFVVVYRKLYKAED